MKATEHGYLTAALVAVAPMKLGFFRTPTRPPDNHVSSVIATLLSRPRNLDSEASQQLPQVPPQDFA